MSLRFEVRLNRCWLTAPARVRRPLPGLQPRNRVRQSSVVGNVCQTMTLDPRYALAWSALAMAHAASPINSDVAPLDVWPRARAAAMEAVRTGPHLAEAQFAFGYVNWLFDWVGPPPSARHTTASRLRFGPTRWRKQAAPATRGPHLIASRQSREALCAAERVRASPRGPGTTRCRLRLAGARLRGARRSRHVPDRRSQVGSISR